VLDCVRVGEIPVFAIRATLTPFATMPPAALTMLTAVAFCIALPERLTV